MILVVNICKEELSYWEFVKPIEDIIKSIKEQYVVKHYTELNKKDLESAEKIIICGTALKDFEYLNHIKKFKWIKEVEKPILGICAGMQIIVKLFGGELKKKTLIGKYKIHVSKESALIDTSTNREIFAYFLNSLVPHEVDKINFYNIANIAEVSCAIKHKERNIYGVLFHPEVYNKEIIINFIKSI